MEQIIMQINGHFLSVEVLCYNKRIPQTWSEPEEPAHYDIGEVVLIANPILDYNEVEETVGVYDLWESINYILLEEREK